MTYRGFLSSFTVSLKGRTVFLVDGGVEAVRADVVRLIERRLCGQIKGLKVPKIKKITYSLSEISSSPSVILVESVYNLVIIYWEKGLLDEKGIKQLLRGCRDTKSWFVIVDGIGEVLKYFKEVFGKDKVGVYVDCSRLPETFEDKISLITKRLSVSGIVMNEDAIKYLASRDSFSSNQMFNTFRILEAVGGSKLWIGANLETLRMYGLLSTNIEQSLMRVLFDKGKIAFLSVPKISYDGERLIRYIIRELILLLKCKTVKGTTDQKRSVAVGLPYPVYQDYRRRADRIDIGLLYRRLFSAIQVLKYGEFVGSSLLLLSMW